MVPKVHRHRIFTNAEKAEIFAMRERGLPYSFIARHYDTTSDTIRHIVCRENKKRAESAATLTAQTKKATNR
jgi:transposase-like protein